MKGQTRQTILHSCPVSTEPTLGIDGHTDICVPPLHSTSPHHTYKTLYFHLLEKPPDFQSFRLGMMQNNRCKTGCQPSFVIMLRIGTDTDQSGYQMKVTCPSGSGERKVLIPNLPCTGVQHRFNLSSLTLCRRMEGFGH